MALTKRAQLVEVLQAAIDLYQIGKLGDAINHLADHASTFPKAAKLWGYLGFLYGEDGDDTVETIRGRS